MGPFEIDQAIQNAISRQLPMILERVIDIKSKIDNLPDYPSQKEGADALGVSPPQISKMIKSGHLQRHYIAGVKTGRLCKKEIKSLLIKQRG